MTTPSYAGSSGSDSASSFRVWPKDRAQVEKDIVEGRPFRVLESERGRYDAMLDFLLESTEFQPVSQS
jgi:hypothetical protein